MNYSEMREVVAQLAGERRLADLMIAVNGVLADRYPPTEMNCEIWLALSDARWHIRRLEESEKGGDER